VGAFSVHTGSADLRDFEQSDWDKKVLDILGHYATLAAQLAAQQEALRVAQDQRALTEAFAAVGDIAANLLHRLNNKVGTIPVRVEGIQDKSAAALSADPYLAKNLEEIRRSAAEAMEVVRESLFHLHPIQLAPVSVSGSIREALSTTNLPEGVQVTVEGIEQLPPVQAGSTRLALVFSNLLENASDAMAGNGKISIRGGARDGLVEVTVSDDGPGIPLEIHERIFEFNYSARVSAHPGKLGFGLWWVKSLMARFGGSVLVESDGMHGSTFRLTLPQASGRLSQEDYVR
jgi:signal transduction histidine kinase